ncbi:TPA: hypothetical protein RQN22_001822 [Aeromonas dhakensis]|nr:hypothetical protein [Aeromonas dhakensis]
MKPFYQSAVIATDGKAKFYETSRVIEIFELVMKPNHKAFYGSLISCGDVCTDEQIETATQAHDEANKRIKQQELIQSKQQAELDLLQAYKESLVDVRDCLVNTNNGKVFLLPEDHGLIGQYQSFLDLEVLQGSLFDFIEKHSTSLVDTFILEKVTMLTASRIMELEDDSE